LAAALALLGREQDPRKQAAAKAIAAAAREPAAMRGRREATLYFPDISCKYVPHIRLQVK
jgi:hypothetical protein